jgi:hypothetical protein
MSARPPFLWRTKPPISGHFGHGPTPDFSTFFDMDPYPFFVINRYQERALIPPFAYEISSEGGFTPLYKEKLIALADICVSFRFVLQTTPEIFAKSCIAVSPIPKET